MSQAEYDTSQGDQERIEYGETYYEARGNRFYLKSKANFLRGLAEIEALAPLG